MLSSGIAISNCEEFAILASVVGEEGEAGTGREADGNGLEERMRCIRSIFKRGG